MDCVGISGDGDRCSLSAGHGTDDPLFCYHHDDQHAIKVDSDLFGGYRAFLIFRDLPDGVTTVNCHVQLDSGERASLELSALSVGHPESDVDAVFDHGEVIE